MKVTAAAIRDDDGKVWTLPAPARHHNILRHMYDSGKPGSFLDGQGFVLEDGTFVNRKVAAKLAVESGQIKKTEYVDGQLFSEDLW